MPEIGPLTASSTVKSAFPSGHFLWYAYLPAEGPGTYSRPFLLQSVAGTAWCSTVQCQPGRPDDGGAFLPHDTDSPTFFKKIKKKLIKKKGRKDIACRCCHS